MARTLLQRLILLLKPPEGQQHLKRHLTVGPYKLPEAVGPRRRARAGGGSAQSNDRATRCKSWGGGARVGAVGWREGAGACGGGGGEGCAVRTSFGRKHLRVGATGSMMGRVSSLRVGATGSMMGSGARVRMRWGRLVGERRREICGR